MAEPANPEPANPEPVPAAPSRWVSRFLPAAETAGGRVLDLAAGRGRHVRLARSRGWRVTAVDRETGPLAALAAEDGAIAVLTMDLEAGAAADAMQTVGAAGAFDIVVVCNYLHRPLLRHLPALLNPGGRLIYETFMLGNEAYSRPRNPDFLLRPGELPAAFDGLLTVLAFEQGYEAAPSPRVVQRYAGTAAPAPAALPPAGGEGGTRGGTRGGK